MALSVAEAIAKVKEVKAQLDAGDVAEFTEELDTYAAELFVGIDDADDDEDDDFVDLDGDDEDDDFLLSGDEDD